MSLFDDNLPGMISALTKFDESNTPPLDKDGCFEAVLIPLKDVVIFPQMVLPLFIVHPAALAAARAARADHQTAIFALQKNPDNDEPKPEDFYQTGTECALGQMLQMPDGATSVLVQGKRRVEIVKWISKEDSAYPRLRVRPLDEPDEKTSSIEAQMRAVLTLFEQAIQLSRSIPEEAYIFAMNIKEPGWLADMIATSMDLDLDERQRMLDIRSPVERLAEITVMLGKELEVLQLEDEIHMQVLHEVDKGQREMLLREQMRAIQIELGEIDLFEKEVSDLRERLAAHGLPDDVSEVALRELDRLSSMPSMSPERGIIHSYISWILDLPWQDATVDNLDLQAVTTVLDADHFGVKKAKDRILEHIAVRKLAADRMRSPILCFLGPPGTGKTSLGRSIARALGREFVRISLGGVRDEAEIRGHRRTYVGALPGRIIQGMRRAGTVNPVFMLDEIDKLGQDFRGDPASALLEILDPEQNHAFSDHYLEVDYDLSRVLFITTANAIDTVPPALEDRLEIIPFTGYIEEEKLHIARGFLIPRLLEEHGLNDSGIHFENRTLQTLIRDYTYEAGVRNFDRVLASLCRKIARRIAEGHGYPQQIKPEHLGRFLGPSEVPLPLIMDEDEIGIAQGIAWTEVGGDIFPVEVSIMLGKGNLTLTGSLGEIMQESAQTAVSYMRARADVLSIDPDRFENVDIHVHLPEGAIPKDGPSAGITLATALISAFTNRPVRRDVVMTGEVTLRGRVLPVGGLKEKILAAHRVGIRKVIIPAENEKDLIELPRKALKDLTIISVKHMDQVLDQTLLPPLDLPLVGERRIEDDIE
jgi:ATP-dependent Lon protease